MKPAIFVFLRCLSGSSRQITSSRRHCPQASPPKASLTLLPEERPGATLRSLHPPGLSFIRGPRCSLVSCTASTSPSTSSPRFASSWSWLGPGVPGRRTTCTPTPWPHDLAIRGALSCGQLSDTHTRRLWDSFRGTRVGCLRPLPFRTFMTVESLCASKVKLLQSFKQWLAAGIEKLVQGGGKRCGLRCTVAATRSPGRLAVNSRGDRSVLFRRTARVRHPPVRRTLDLQQACSETGGPALQPARTQTAATAPAS